MQVKGAVIVDDAAQAGSTFNLDVFQSHPVGSLGTCLLSCGSIASTQQFMQDNRMYLPPGTVFVADEQFAGKGRAGNTWTSPAGCLMVSLIFNSGLAGRLADTYSFFWLGTLLKFLYAMYLPAIRAAFCQTSC